MESHPLRRHSILPQDGVINCTIKQLSPSIWNARLVLQVLKMLPISTSHQGTTLKGVSLIARDVDSMVQICAWDSQNIAKSISLRFGDTIEVLFPDVKFRRANTLGFPGTIDYELHVGATEEPNSTQREGKASITATSAVLVFDESLAPNSYSSFAEVCIKECLNSIVTVGAILMTIGELKNGSGESYRTHRLWDPKLPIGQRYVNLTLWGADMSYFEKATVGDFVLAERVKVIQFRGSLQLATSHTTLIYINPPLRAADLLKAQYNDFKSPTLDQPPRPPMSSMVKDAEVFAFRATVHPKSRVSKPKTPVKPKFVASARITDFFPLASSMNSNPLSSEPRVDVAPCPRTLVSSQDDLEPVFVSGRFSVNDGLQLCEGQYCHSIACLSSVLPRTSRGLCIYNCNTCMRPGASCECSLSLKSCSWSYDVRVSWKDHQSEIEVNLNSSQAARLFGIEPSLFVDLEDEMKYETIDSLIGRTYRIVFAKVQGTTHAKEFFELPVEQ